MNDKTAMLDWGRKKRLFVYDWPYADAFQSFAPLAHLPYSLFLDSNRSGHPLNQYSYICWHPFETIESKDGKVSITNREHDFSYTADPFHVVGERLALWGEQTKIRNDLPPLQGGAAGFFGYDLMRGIENIPFKNKEPSRQPDMCIGLYDKVLAFDHLAKNAFLMIHATDESAARIHKEILEKTISSFNHIAEYSAPSLSWKTQRNDREFKNDIAKIIEYIYAGDIFQANLSRRFTAEIQAGFDPIAHYAHLRNINPAPYSSYMNFGGLTLASSSPERFLQVKDGIIETRPIKGTLPSSLPASALQDSEKDVAENVMIVDLLRNDLSKVCEDHSVEVLKLCDIETFEGLHHMVSTVRGALRADKSALDALRACFPGGSITGAPKIRAMEIIDELEQDARGAYCGAIGYIGFDGAMDTAITIRTLVYEDNTVFLQTGGGITAQSDPAKELEETLVKASKIFESFEGKDRMKKTA